MTRLRSESYGAARRAAYFCLDLVLMVFWQVVLCLWLGAQKAWRWFKDNCGTDGR